MKIFGKIKYKTKSIFSGLTDILATIENDQMQSSPFNVRFGKLKFINKKQKCFVQCYNFIDDGIFKEVNLIKVNIYVNNILQNIEFVLDDEYIGYFCYTNEQDIKEIRQLQQQNGIEIQQFANQNRQLYVLSTIPTSSTLKQMNLQKGMNLIKYEVECKYLGKRQQTCQLYLILDENKIFISDIDGTISKSPFRGMVLEHMGKDYIHQDICEFYNQLQQKGYQIVYLSARSMIQYESTRQFLERLEQNNIKLPYGPLILSPMKLMDAFKTEMINKQTDSLKEQIILQIKSLFKVLNVGAIGDSQNDMKAYFRSGIDKSRILQINKESKIQIQNEEGNNIKEIIQKIDQIF